MSRKKEFILRFLSHESKQECFALKIDTLTPLEKKKKKMFCVQCTPVTHSRPSSQLIMLLFSRKHNISLFYRKYYIIINFSDSSSLFKFETGTLNQHIDINLSHFRVHDASLYNLRRDSSRHVAGYIPVSNLNVFYLHTWSQCDFGGHDRATSSTDRVNDTTFSIDLYCLREFYFLGFWCHLAS